jgi:ABC-type antimicrobial peptide transport system permease subunit
MGHRSKMALTLFAIGLIGFILGVAANIIYSRALPLLLETFPQIIASEWAAWGLVGAFLAIACCLIYAYLL